MDSAATADPPARPFRGLASRTARSAAQKVLERRFSVGCGRGGGGSPQGRDRRVSEKRRREISRPHGAGRRDEDRRRDFRSEGRCSPKSMLARQVKSNPEAAEGLRKAVADTILAKAKGTTQSGTSGIDSLSPSGLKKFLHDNVAAIKTAGFSDREFGLDAGRRPRPATWPTHARGDATVGPIQYGSGHHQSHRRGPRRAPGILILCLDVGENENGHCTSA